MKNILFLTTSPTVGGNGDTLIDAAIEEAKTHEAKVHIVHVREKRLDFVKPAMAVLKPVSVCRKMILGIFCVWLMKKMLLLRRRRFIIIAWQRR